MVNAAQKIVSCQDGQIGVLVFHLLVNLGLTAWKVSKYGVISGLVRISLCSDWIRRFTRKFSPNTGKYGPEITPYLDTFQAVIDFIFVLLSVAVTQSCSTKKLLLKVLGKFTTKYMYRSFFTSAFLEHLQVTVLYFLINLYWLYS